MRLLKPFRLALSTIARIFSLEVSVVRTTHSARTSPAGGATRVGVCERETTAANSRNKKASAVCPRARVNFFFLIVRLKSGVVRHRDTETQLEVINQQAVSPCLIPLNTGSA